MPFQLDGHKGRERRGVCANLLVAPEQVVSDALAAGWVVSVIRDLAGELLEAEEVGLDSVQPTGIGGREDGLNVALSHEVGQEGGFVTAEVVHHDVESDLGGVAGSQLLKHFQDVDRCLAFVDFADKAFGVDIIESQKLLGALKPSVGSPQAARLTAWTPGAPMDGAKLKGAALIEANYRSACRGSVVEVEDAVFFTSNCGSGDSFQVLVR